MSATVRASPSIRQRLSELHPLIWIVAMVVLGLVLAAGVLVELGSACRDATTNRAHEGHLVWVVAISAETCRAMTKSPPWFLLSGLVAGPSVLLTWFWRDEKRREDHALARESGASARYTAAAQLLHSDLLMARINGLFALWDLAQESPNHRRTVADTIAAFVSTKTEIDDRGELTDNGPPSADVQSAMRILTFPEWTSPPWLRKGARIPLDLRHRELAQIDLERAVLDGINLSASSLVMANLTYASLRGTNLAGSHFYGAVLAGADLQEADLSRARFDNTSASHAQLQRADLTSAVLERSSLFGADLSGATLFDADLASADLLTATLKGALYNRSTKFPPGFDPSEHGMISENQQLGIDTKLGRPQR